MTLKSLSDLYYVPLRAAALAVCELSKEWSYVEAGTFAQGASA